MKLHYISVLPIFFLFLFLGACNSNTGSNTQNTSNNNNTQLLPGEIMVDGHVLNGSFYVDGKQTQYNARVSSFDQNGKLTDYYKLYTWTGNTSTNSDDYKYSYNSQGELVEKDENYLFTDMIVTTASEHSFYKTTYEYDGQGHLITETMSVVKDENTMANPAAPGTIVYIKTYDYDSQGRLQKLTVDENGDGQRTSSADTITTYEYDSNNNPVTEYFDYHSNVDPDLVQVTENEFDANGLKTKATVYGDLNAYYNDDKTSVTNYFYNANGDVEREEIDTGEYNSSVHTLDGIPDVINTYSYGADGELIEKDVKTQYLDHSTLDVTKYANEVTDKDGNGIPETVAVYVARLDTVTNPNDIPSVLPTWYINEQASINNGNSNDGWTQNWEGTNLTQTQSPNVLTPCEGCNANMVGIVNELTLGY